MRLLIISDAWHPQLNGVVRTYEYLIEELEKKGHEVRVIGPSDFPRKFSMPGYPEIKLAFLPYRHLKKLADQYDPDYIHVATEGPLGWAGRKYGMKYNFDFTTCYHTQFPDYIAKRLPKALSFLHKPVHFCAKKFIKKFHAPAKSILVATESLKKQLEDWKFPSPLSPLTRGVDSSLFYLGDGTAFQDLKKPIALYVGRVAVEKNIEAFLEMEWSGSKIVVGDGPSLETLKKKFKDIHFLGKKTGEELGNCYRSSDIFVFPSRTDTFGIVLIEALACGLPVAAFNATGPIDIITKPYLGALHADNLSIAAEQALKNGISEKCASHVKKHYNWEIATQQFIDAIVD